MQIKIQRWGNSAAIRLNKNILRLLSIEIGSILDIEIKENSLVLHPSSLEYKLDNLLDGSPPGSFSLTQEDHDWLESNSSKNKSI